MIMIKYGISLLKHTMGVDYPVENSDGSKIKRARIVCRKEDVDEIAHEIVSKLPNCIMTKQGKRYYSWFVFGNDWSLEIMTYRQDPDEFEGPLISWTWLHKYNGNQAILNACHARHSCGGALIITQ